MYRPRKKFQFKQRFFLINFHKILFFTSYKKKKKSSIVSLESIKIKKIFAIKKIKISQKNFHSQFSRNKLLVRFNRTITLSHPASILDSTRGTKYDIPKYDACIKCRRWFDQCTTRHERFPVSVNPKRKISVHLEMLNCAKRAP